MATPTLADNAGMSAPPPPRLFRRVGVRLAINQLACTLIAVLLWMLVPAATFFGNWVFSIVIGNCCWALIDGGLGLAARVVRRHEPGPPDWPGWRWAVPIVLLGTVVGYLVGHALASWLLGYPVDKVLDRGRLLFASVVAAMTISYFFYARERVHSQHLQTLAAERLASDMQLKLLQSQLEPHMLFNTLANLRVLIGLDPPQAQAMLDHLIAFLRSTLQSTRVDHHSLQAEFDALRDYLALMAVRMGARLQPSFDLPPELRDVPVPPLLLQPLVENAIKHGLEPHVAGGRLEVSAQRDGARLLLHVRDTGVGLGSAATARGTGFGLEQVRQRLAARFADRASLALEAATDGAGGTLATITLPLQPDRA